jgi:hypothetical protein
MAPLYQMNKKNDSISIEKLPADTTPNSKQLSEQGIEVSRELKKRELE